MRKKADKPKPKPAATPKLLRAAVDLEWAFTKANGDCPLCPGHLGPEQRHEPSCAVGVLFRAIPP